MIRLFTCEQMKSFELETLLRSVFAPSWSSLSEELSKTGRTAPGTIVSRRGMQIAGLLSEPCQLHNSPEPEAAGFDQESCRGLSVTPEPTSSFNVSFSRATVLLALAPLAGSTRTRRHLSRSSPSRARDKSNPIPSYRPRRGSFNCTRTGNV